MLVSQVCRISSLLWKRPHLHQYLLGQEEFWAQKTATTGQASLFVLLLRILGKAQCFSTFVCETLYFWSLHGWIQDKCWLERSRLSDSRLQFTLWVGYEALLVQVGSQTDPTCHFCCWYEQFSLFCILRPQRIKHASSFYEFALQESFILPKRIRR